MNQSCSGLKPGTAEGEGGPWYFGHAEDSDVEAAAGFNITDDKRDVVKLMHSDWRLHCEWLRWVKREWVRIGTLAHWRMWELAQ